MVQVFRVFVFRVFTVFMFRVFMFRVFGVFRAYGSGCSGCSTFGKVNGVTWEGAQKWPKFNMG